MDHLDFDLFDAKKGDRKAIASILRDFCSTLPPVVGTKYRTEFVKNLLTKLDEALVQDVDTKRMQRNVAAAIGATAPKGGQQAEWSKERRIQQQVNRLTARTGLSRSKVIDAILANPRRHKRIAPMMGKANINRICGEWDEADAIYQSHLPAPECRFE